MFQRTGLCENSILYAVYQYANQYVSCSASEVKIPPPPPPPKKEKSIPEGVHGLQKVQDSSKLVRLMLAILWEIELLHWNNLRILSSNPKQPSYKTPLDGYFESIAWNVYRGGFTTQSYIQDSTFYKTRQQLKFNYLDKHLHTRHLTGFLMHPIVIIPTLILHLTIYTKCFA